MVSGPLPRNLVHVKKEDRPVFSFKPVKCQHRLPDLPYFSDSEIIELLDKCPRNRLRVWHSGTDPKNFSDWIPVDTTGIDGAKIFECLFKGRFWVNVQRIDLFDDRFRVLSNELYSGLSRQCPHFVTDFTHSYLLLSSPKAFVYLHLDSYENFFWCIRGGKIFHLYPPDDRRMVSQEVMEDICAGADDFFEYKDEFSELRSEYELNPGDMLSWPQHSPHQVFNNGELNVGLGTFHGTARGTQKVLDYVASRYLRENLPFLRGRVRHGALGTTLRRNGFRVMRRLGWAPENPATQFWTKYRLDPDAPQGLSEINEGPILAECSRAAA